MYWWSDFDAGEVMEEFSIIRDIGFNLVRVFLLWEDWQPAADTISDKALGDLEVVCDIADELGLQLDLTFFTGHMSGPNWVPPWMLRIDLQKPDHVRQVVSGGVGHSGGYINPYVHPLALKAEKFLLRTIVERFHGHPAIGLWNLGNEPDLLAWPPDRESGQRWVKDLMCVIREIDNQTPVTCGLHVESILQNNNLRVDDVFGEVDVVVMHGYPMYIDWLDDPLDPEFIPFLCALTTALSGNQTLMEEFGGCTTPPGMPSTYLEWTSYGSPRRQFMASEEDLANYLSHVLPGLVQVGALGALLWCFADYTPALYDRPPCDESIHERTFGIVRHDGTLKPHAQVVSDFARTNPLIQQPEKTFDISMTADEFYLDPIVNSIQLYTRYCSL